MKKTMLILGAVLLIVAPVMVWGQEAELSALQQIIDSIRAQINNLRLQQAAQVSGIGSFSTVTAIPTYPVSAVPAPFSADIQSVLQQISSKIQQLSQITTNLQSQQNQTGSATDSFLVFTDANHTSEKLNFVSELEEVLARGIAASGSDTFTACRLEKGRTGGFASCLCNINNSTARIASPLSNCVTELSAPGSTYQTDLRWIVFPSRPPTTQPVEENCVYRELRWNSRRGAFDPYWICGGPGWVAE